MEELMVVVFTSLVKVTGYCRVGMAYANTF